MFNIDVGMKGSTGTVVVRAAHTKKKQYFMKNMFDIGVGVNGVEWDGRRQSRAGKQISIFSTLLWG